MFWVFDSQSVNDGVINHLRDASPDRELTRITLVTALLPKELLQDRMRLSAINGGASNGAFPRGTATYKTIVEWTGGRKPREIGLRNGIPAEFFADLRPAQAVTIADG